MAGTARLWSWTTFHREYFAGYPLAPPYTVLMVELTEGVRMLATLPTDIDPACLYCDQPMQFRSSSNRERPSPASPLSHDQHRHDDSTRGDGNGSER